MKQAETTEVPIDLTDKITLYAGETSPYHKEGEKVEVHPMQKEHFLSHGFTEEAPKKKEVKIVK